MMSGRGPDHDEEHLPEVGATTAVREAIRPAPGTAVRLFQPRCRSRVSRRSTPLRLIRVGRPAT